MARRALQCLLLARRRGGPRKIPPTRHLGRQKKNIVVSSFGANITIVTIVQHFDSSHLILHYVHMLAYIASTD